jgi:L-ascorbate metabolism protein UlaG (beta-lactamase superfamily)
MRLTKLTHACVRLEKDGAVLVIDPGIWTEPDALDGADAVLVTHEHFDHVDEDRLRAALTANPSLNLWTNSSVAEQAAEFGDRVHAVRQGDTFSAAGFDVHVYGEQHALIHRDVPVIANIGFLVDGTVFHPGDSFTVPEEDVPVLLAPVSAPWLKISEMIDYVREVKPRQGFAIHDAILSDKGLGVVGNWVGLAGKPVGAELSRVEPGTSVDL